jgi:hypothetical protein
LESWFRFLSLQSRHEAQIVIRSGRDDLEAGANFNRKLIILVFGLFNP